MNWKLKLIQRLFKGDEYILIRMDSKNGESGVLSYFSKSDERYVDIDGEMYSVKEALAETIAETIAKCPEKAVGELFLDGVGRYLKHREIARKDFLKRID